MSDFLFETVSLITPTGFQEDAAGVAKRFLAYPTIAETNSSPKALEELYTERAVSAWLFEFPGFK